MEFDILKLQNPWWSASEKYDGDAEVRQIQQKSFFYKNPLFKNLKMSPGDFHIIRGPRQVGKTTLLKFLIDRLLIEEKFKPENLCLLSCETIKDFSELNKILSIWLQPRKSYITVLLLDEISFVSEWQRGILALNNMGLLKNCCLIVTGSNARDLKESSERFPGRRGSGLDISYFPLSPLEMKTLNCFKDLTNSEMVKLYLKIGGFPHAIRDYIETGCVSDATFQTYQNWIIGDASRFELNEEFLRHIMNRIFETFCSQITLPKLVETTPIKSHETALSYLEHLDDSFLTRIQYCYDFDKGGPAFHKSRKIFFIDPLLYGVAFSWKNGLSNIWDALQNQIVDNNFNGRLLESAYISCISRGKLPTYFWYSSKLKKEIDLVIERPEKKPAFFECKLHTKDCTLLNISNYEVRVVGIDEFISFQNEWK